MTNTDELVWQDWSATWRSDRESAVLVADIRRAVDRQSRAMRLALMGEVVLTFAALGFVAWIVVAEREVSRWGWVTAVLLHTVTVWAFALWNRRGVWSPLGETVADYLVVARERLERRRLASNFVVALVAMEMVALGIWAAAVSEARADGDSRPFRPWFWVPALGITAVAFGWAAWERRRIAVESTRLEQARRSLTED